MSILNYKVSFRIGNDELNPLEITEILGISPDRAHQKGDPNTSISKKGKVINYSPFSTGVWALTSQADESATLECHLKSLLHILYPLKNELAEFSNRGYRMDMFCGAFMHNVEQPGFEIDSDTLLQLGELNIALGICIYT